MQTTRTQADLRYQTARDRLIPLAESYANQTIPRPHFPRDVSPVAWEHFDLAWSRCFLSRMDELAREKGLVR